MGSLLFGGMSGYPPGGGPWSRLEVAGVSCRVPGGRKWLAWLPGIATGLGWCGPSLLHVRSFRPETPRGGAASGAVGPLGSPVFSRREYTEDGQVKTERKYSYSESRSPPAPVARPSLASIRPPGCRPSEPCCPVCPARLQELPRGPSGGHRLGSEDTGLAGLKPEVSHGFCLVPSAQNRHRMEV